MPSVARVPNPQSRTSPQWPESPESREDAVRALVARVTDPELPMLTLVDLGVLRDVEIVRDVEVGHDQVIVTITPTYSGCPAMATMRDDLVHTLRDHGFGDVQIRVSLHPAWTTDWITERGRRTLAEHGISAPGPAPHHDGPVPLSLRPTRRVLDCPRCGSRRVTLISEFGPTACKAMYRCTACLEPFDHVKEI